MYKAIKKIGEYGIGDIVPDKQAEVWLEAYAVPQVEKFEDVKQVKKSDEKEETKREDTVSTLLKEYLSKNQSIVRKSIVEDVLNKNQLEQLLGFEKNGENRPLVLNAIKQRLKQIR